MTPSASSLPHRYSSSSSSSVSSSSLSTAPSTTSIPFSWEELPGVPKLSPTKPNTPDPTLPLPPPLRCNSAPIRHKKKLRFPEVASIHDPFTVALFECSKHYADTWDTPAPPLPKLVGRHRANDRTGFGFGLGFRSLDLYASCKTTCTIVDSAVYVPRSGRYDLLNRRSA